MADKRPDTASRRGFFRLSLDRVRDSALEAARELAKASAQLADAAAEATADPDEVPRYHRARPRATGADAPRRVVRPPGALAEPAFLAACERCRACVDACPEGAIFRAGPQHGAAVELTPMMRPDQRPCALCADVPCAAACPSGALVPLPASEIRLARAVVMEKLCLNSRGETCDACLPGCPIPGAIVAGSDRVPIVAEDLCTGCGVCARDCRAYPKAIHLSAL